MDMLAQNIRFAFRTLRRNPLFAVFAIVTLGLGIGANAAIFSVIDGVLLKPLPYASGDRLVLINQSTQVGGRPNASVSIKELYDYREQSATFDALVEYHQMNFDLLRKGDPDRVNTGVVSHDFFNVLGITPIFGRTFVAADDEPGADAVLVLSHGYWEKAFGSDPNVVGSIVQMNDRPHTIVGVLPSVLLYPQENDVYMSVSACPFRAAAEKRIVENRRAFAGLTVFGRIKEGVSRLQADADIKRIASSFVAENPAAYRTLEGFAAATLAVREQLTQQAKPVLLILLGTTGFVLLIACVNIANLSLARLLNRERELAVRAALGAGRRQLVAQLLTESTVLSVIGAAVGLLFAGNTVSMLASFAGRFTTRTHQIEIDPRVLLFTLALSISHGCAVWTLSGPAVEGQSSRIDEAGRRQRRTEPVARPPATDADRRPGRLCRRAARRCRTAADDGLSAAEGGPRLSRRSRDQRRGIYQFLEIPGYPVAADVLRSRLAPTGRVSRCAIRRRHQRRSVECDSAGGKPADVQRGRGQARPEKDGRREHRVARLFRDARDSACRWPGLRRCRRPDSRPVAIVNNEMAKYWSGGALGREVSFDSGKTWVSIVGIAGDTRQYGVNRPPLPEIFIPLAQSPGLGGRIIVRTNGDPVEFASTLRQAVHDVDPDMPVKNIVTLPDLREQALATPRLTAVLLLIFALIALTVTLAGVSGVIAISVTHRLKEFGIRMALGASRGQVLGVVVKEGLVLVAAGLVPGICGSFAATRSLSAYLYRHTAPIR